MFYEIEKVCWWLKRAQKAKTLGEFLVVELSTSQGTGNNMYLAVFKNCYEPGTAVFYLFWIWIYLMVFFPLIRYCISGVCGIDESFLQFTDLQIKRNGTWGAYPRNHTQRTSSDLDDKIPNLKSKPDELGREVLGKSKFIFLVEEWVYFACGREMNWYDRKLILADFSFQEQPLHYFWFPVIFQNSVTPPLMEQMSHSLRPGEP